MSPSRCDRRGLSLALVATVSNAAYASIAPILPLEIDKHHIPERWVSLPFLAFSVGSFMAPPLVASFFSSIGTLKVMAYSMVGMSLLFLFLGYVFDIAALLSSYASTNHTATVVLLTTFFQFFMGFFFSTIATGYYSLATLFSLQKESAMSTIEAAVGTGYIIGPIFGSFVYEEMGYQYTYSFISLLMMVLAAVTWKILSRYFKCKAPDSDFEAQNGFVNYKSFENENIAPGRDDNGESLVNINAQQKRSVQQSLLKFPPILFAATTIMWINVSWTCIEPLLAKRLDNFHVGKKEIGIIFSLTNIVYVPTVFLARYLPKQYTLRHKIISLSTMLTPIAVLFVGSSAFWVMILGITLLGLFPTPVWIMLLPFMQEESVILFQDPKMKRCVNDITAGIYNSFMALGQVLGYAIGPLMGSHGFGVVALLIFLQSMLFYFGTKEYKLRRERSAVHY